MLDEISDEVALGAAALLAGLALLVGLWLGAKLSAWWRGLRAGARARRGHRGEGQAERLLRRAGYRIVERHARRSYQAQLDGAPARVELIADYLVRGRAGLQVAEVKTGALCRDFGHAATRRQLLEYQLAFGGEGILLVDMETRRVRQVRFPF